MKAIFHDYIYIEEGKFSLASDCVLQAKLSKSDYQKNIREIIRLL